MDAKRICMAILPERECKQGGSGNSFRNVITKRVLSLVNTSTITADALTENKAKEGMDVMEHLWEVSHSYYCNLGNYTDNNAGSQYQSLDEFLGDWEGADLDYNLLFRWDWYDSEDPDNELEQDELHVFWMLQRKGHYTFSEVKLTKEDEPRVIEFLKPRWEYMKKLWNPLD